jgi:hypothetical protein
MRMPLDSGSYAAVTKAVLTVMRAGGKIVGRTHEKTAGGEAQETATVGVDPTEVFRVNWVG